MKIVIFALTTVLSLVFGKSHGCASTAVPHGLGKSVAHNMTMVDPATKDKLTRHYTVNLPAGYKPGQ